MRGKPVLKHLNELHRFKAVSRGIKWRNSSSSAEDPQHAEHDGFVEKPTDVKRVAWLSTERQEALILAKGLPAVLTGALSQWRVTNLRLVDLDVLRDRVVPVEVSEGNADYRQALGGLPQPGRFEADVEVPLGLLLDHIFAPIHPQGVRLYLAQKDVRSILPELAAEERQLPFRQAAERLFQQSIWLGPPGTRSPTHRDPYENLLCQVWGSKRVHIFPPAAAGALQPFAQPHTLRNTSKLDLDSPEMAAALRLAQSCVLGEGEVLYIPTGWWHHVEAIQGASYSLSFWWPRAAP